MIFYDFMGGYKLIYSLNEAKFVDDLLIPRLLWRVLHDFESPINFPTSFCNGSRNDTRPSLLGIYVSFLVGFRQNWINQYSYTEWWEQSCPVGIYMFKVMRRFGVFIVNFEHISHLVLVFLLLILSR